MKLTIKELEIAANKLKLSGDNTIYIQAKKDEYGVDNHSKDLQSFVFELLKTIARFKIIFSELTSIYEHQN